ncbi:MAG TPA: CinA family protein [Candidatus Hydrogenedentes bacterium]|nr:CinA family protein [Candidatus Hydrogenedentota bacterium]
MPESYEFSIVQRLTKVHRTVVTAESCSGGLIAHRITNIPGSSVCYRGGVVAYSNVLKEHLLGVARTSLESHGAVSETVAREMAEGARVRLDADWAVAVTGIAGPSGGTAEKPVGLVWMAVAGAEETCVKRFVFEGTRESIKAQTAENALAMLWEWLDS